MNNLYSKQEKSIMQTNLNYTSMSANRVEEIRNFARGANYERIGIAHCITFSYEAEVLKKYLSNYFEVFTVDCKYGRLRASELLGGSSRRVLCNPAGQADYLNQQNTDLNISMGLCVGHDMIFSKKSDAFVTNLFDKDFTNNNNISQAISEIERSI